MGAAGAPGQPSAGVLPGLVGHLWSLSLTHRETGSGVKWSTDFWFCTGSVTYWLWCVPRVIFPKLKDQEEAGKRVGMLLENYRVTEREIETKKQREAERDTEKKRQTVKQRDTERETEMDREKYIHTDKRHRKKDREREVGGNGERKKERRGKQCHNFGSEGKDQLEEVMAKINWGRGGLL